MNPAFFTRLALLISISLCPFAARAQWLTQSFVLTNGWNAVYLNVDASHTNLDGIIGGDSSNPILEIWRWNPAGTMQFAEDPADPTDAGSQWISWNRNAANNGLRNLVGNSAYLVRVGTTASPTYTWTVKGKPVPPINEWTTTGLNFIGFPTVPGGAPLWDSFLTQSSDLTSAKIYFYRGGNLSTNNPSPLLTLHTSRVQRGQAYWVRNGTVFNHYFGPFELDLQSSAGVHFGESSSAYTLRLKNLTPGTLTVTLRLVASENPPPGEANIAGLPPMLVRGAINLTNLTYGYTNLPANTPRSWTLAGKDQPGSEVEVVLGLNRAAMTDSVGSLLAGVLRFTDSLGFSQLDTPVSAVVGSRAGLWVGQATVTQVGQYMKSYAHDAGGAVMISSNGQYAVTSVDTSLAQVARPYPLRLIVHNPANNSSAALLQRVFYGADGNTNLVVATQESVLNHSLLAQARRLTATHLPWSSTNAPWFFDGNLSASNLTATVTLGYNDHTSNPFLHTYHPDHDNLDASFKTVLAPGSESYTIRRAITLVPSPPGSDFNSLVNAAQTVVGDYQETLTVLGLPRPGNTNDTRVFQTRGTFKLNRISDIPTLTVVP